jgi:hypothetical protein
VVIACQETVDRRLVVEGTARVSPADAGDEFNTLEEVDLS